MDKLFIWFLLISFSDSSLAQEYKTSDIIKKADSLIISVVGQDVFDRHYELDTTVKVEPVQSAIDKEEKIRHISLSSKTNKRFKLISVDYIFYIKKYEPPLIRTRVVLDKRLNLYFPVDTSFIPKFVLRKTINNFLTKEQALEIAKSRFKRRGLKVDSRIYFDPSQKNYVWEITNVLKEFSGHSRSIEQLKIEPVNGKIVSYLEGLSGRLD